MAQVLFRRPRTSGRRTSWGKTFNLKNGRQCGKSEVSCEVRSSNDVENDQQWVKFEPVYRPSNFNTGFGHDESVRQDGSKEHQDWAEGQSEGCVSWSSGPPWEGARIRESRYHRWWIMDFGVRPRDKRPKSGVAHCKLSPSQESENEQIQNQIDAHLLFFDSQGIVHKEFVPPGQTVNQTFYREVLERLWKRVARVRPGIERTWMLHHDNVPCHTAVSINEFLAEKTFLRFLSPPIRQMSVSVTSFYSSGSKTTWKGTILIIWIISNRA